MGVEMSRLRSLRFLGFTALVLAFGVVLFGSLGFRLNVSASLPYGVYKTTNTELEVGSLVTFCVPDRMAHLKVFKRATTNVCINGVGKPLLKRVVGINEKSGAITVAGDTDRSIDSRWFGVLYADELASTAKPVLVFGFVF